MKKVIDDAFDRDGMGSGSESHLQNVLEKALEGVEEGPARKHTDRLVGVECVVGYVFGRDIFEEMGDLAFVERILGYGS